MLHLARKTRSSFYYTAERRLPIHDDTYAKFSKQKGQRELLLALDSIHGDTQANTAIEFDKIQELITSNSDNYIRRTITKLPLADYIKELEFTDTTGNAHRYAKCITLDYERLSNIKTAPTSEIVIEKQINNDIQPETEKSQVLLENELAKQEGFDKSLAPSVSFATPELSRFLSLARNAAMDKDLQPLGDGSFVKITTSKEQERIVNAKDVVVILACVYLTYAYHHYRLPFYQQNAIKTPPNRTVVSLNIIRKLMKKSRTTEVNYAIRESLDITRETAFDFMLELMMDDEEVSSQLKSKIVRRRILECDSIINEKLKTLEDADKAFYKSNIFILKWDEELFASIIDSNSLFALPPDLIAIEPILVVLYLKLRSMKKLRFKASRKTNVELEFVLSSFLANYMNVSQKEFLKILQQAKRSNERKKSAKIQGLDIELGESHCLLKLFGYTFTFDLQKDAMSLVANQDDIHQYAKIESDRRTPTHENTLAMHLMQMIAEDDEVNSQVKKRRLKLEKHRHYILVNDPNVEGQYIVTSRTTDDTLMMYATLLQDESNSVTELMLKLKDYRARCEPMALAVEYQRKLLRTVLRYFSPVIAPTSETLVKFLADNPSLEAMLVRSAEMNIEFSHDIIMHYVHFLNYPDEAY